MTLIYECDCCGEKYTKEQMNIFDLCDGEKLYMCEECFSFQVESLI